MKRRNFILDSAAAAIGTMLAAPVMGEPTPAIDGAVLCSLSCGSCGFAMYIDDKGHPGRSEWRYWTIRCVNGACEKKNTEYRVPLLPLERA